MRPTTTPYRAWSVAAVSLYLAFVGLFLVVTRRIPFPARDLRIALRAHLRRPYAGALGDISHESGHCYQAPLPPRLMSDADIGSRLAIYEDGRPLGPGHAMHDDIRRLGEGRYSHWGAAILFSTRDNTDPRSNGRRYTVRERSRRDAA